MKPSTKRLFNKSVAAVTLFCMAAQPVLPAAIVGLDLATEPLFIGSAVPPMVMLNVPKDHQMFGKLYNDFADVNGDGIPDTGYNHSIEYYGYFDPFKCYQYSNNIGAGRTGFEPKVQTTDKYCSPGSNQWSGNFLNWVTMTRLDAVRKLLYGGFRTVDDVGLTILERAPIPTDGHAWAKHYRGRDVSQLTPYNVATAEIRARSSSTMTIGSFRVVKITRPPCPIFIPICTVTATAEVGPGHTVVPGGSVTFDGGTGAETVYNGPKVATGVTLNTISFSVTVATGVPVSTVSPFVYRPALTIDQPASGRKFLVGDMVTIRHDADNLIEGVIAAVSALSGTITLELFPQELVANGVSWKRDPIAFAAQAPATFGSWNVINRSSPGITICNTTNVTGTTFPSHQVITNSSYPPATNASFPPLIRVAEGDFSLWAVAESKECQWGGGANNNNYFESGLKASAASPVQAQVGLITAPSATPDYAVRVRVCDATLLGEKEKCVKYEGVNNWKPTGLLQQYGSSNRKLIQFGLMTPSYSKNKSGGVLRKQVSFLDGRTDFQSPYTATDPDELDPVSGRFRNVDGIVKTLNGIQIYGYLPTGTYSGSGADNCAGVLVNPGEDNCTSWGNPTSEMFIETLRYLAGKGTPSGSYIDSPPAGDTFGTGGLTKDAALSMKVQGWNKPLTNDNWCAPLNVIVMNASVSSYDNDQIPTDLFTGGATAHTETFDVGKQEGLLAGISVLAGKVDQPAITSAPHPVNDAAAGIGLCTPKKLGSNGLADVMGICPEAPVLGGSYLMAGAAQWARNNRIIPNLKRAKGGDLPPGDVTSARVNTYGITLSGASPKINVDVPDTGGKRKVTILPAGRTLSSGTTYAGTGAIVDFKIVRQNTRSASDPLNTAAYQRLNGPPGTGKFFVSWEDSMQGSDYDLDAWGILEYEFLPAGGPYTQVRVTTDIIYAISVYTMGFGYVISGVTKGKIDHNGKPTYGEGVHYTSAHRGGTGGVFNWPPANMTIGGQGMTLGDECSDCQFTQPRRSITFDLPNTDTASVALQEPLYYAAKYGGYKDNNRNGKRDDGEWDAKVKGTPDNYFLVTNPARLEEALEQSFISILAQASASSVATNSTSLQTGTRIYQARFNTNDWSGQVLAFDVNANGSINPVPAWDAGDLLKSTVVRPDTRMILTYDPGSTKGVEFKMPGAPAELKKALYTPPGSATQDPAGIECTSSGPSGLLPAGCTRLGEMRLNYLRGDGANEGSAGTNFRPRPVTKLGDIVNSNPNFVGVPNAGFADQDYAGFRAENINRRPMIYVGANDGMLHGFSVNEKGKEYFGYIPTRAWPSLTALTDKAYKHRYLVDGSPEVSDAFVSRDGVNAWRTVLVSGLGAGGQGVFALDVTKPETFLDPATAVKNVMWEFTDRDDPNLGYVLGQPVIRRMHSDSTTYPNGRWAVIIPGGYNNSEGTDSVMPNETACTDSAPTSGPVAPLGCTTSTTGFAYLFILFLDGPGADGKWDLGTDYIRISTDVGDRGNPNGLAAPFAADVNADGKVDYIYAGDLQGNMFKFDVTSDTPSLWSNPSNRVVLFTAKIGTEVQPITAKAEGTLHPSGQGFVIAFGTGKYLERRDPDPAPTDPRYPIQSFYGIWDKNDDKPIAGQSRVTNRNQLMEQKIDTVTHTVTLQDGTTANVNFRVVSQNVPGDDGVPPWSSDKGAPPNDASTGTAVMGWFMDFPDAADGKRSGERSVFRPLLLSGRLLFTTLIPNPLKCEAGGTSFLMVVDPVTGGRINSPVLDVDGKGELNSKDKLDFGGTQVFASGVESAIGITPTPTIVRSDTGGQSNAPGGSEVFLGTRGPLIAGAGFLLAYALAAGSSGGNSSTMIGLAAMGGRVSWRELMTD